MLPVSNIYQCLPKKGGAILLHVHFIHSPESSCTAGGEDASRLKIGRSCLRGTKYPVPAVANVVGSDLRKCRTCPMRLHCHQPVRRVHLNVYLVYSGYSDDGRAKCKCFLLRSQAVQVDVIKTSRYNPIEYWDVPFTSIISPRTT